MKITILQQLGRGKHDAIQRLLVSAGHDCTFFESARPFLDQLHLGDCDLLIIDAQTPGLNVAEVVRLGRGKLEGSLPVLLLVDGTAADDMVAALAAGVDDYLITPLRSKDLLIRTGVLLRRFWSDSSSPGQVQFGPFLFNTMLGCVSMNEHKLTLTKKEFDLALLFFRHLGQPLSRATLLETLWTQDADTPSRTVDTHVSRVRSKLGLHPTSGFRLVPVYGYGYLLERVGE